MIRSRYKVVGPLTTKYVKATSARKAVKVAGYDYRKYNDYRMVRSRYWSDITTGHDIYTESWISELTRKQWSVYARHSRLT